MPSFESVALELLEYKVRDLLAGRQTKGGNAAAWRLHDRLQRSASGLAAADLQRLRQLEQSLRNVSEKKAAAGKPGAQLDLDDVFLPEAGGTAGTVNPLLRDAGSAVRLIPEEALAGATPKAARRKDPALAAEQIALRELAQTVWWHDLERHIQREAGTLRAEKGRHTARLLYALHRNLLRFAAQPDSRNDVKLTRFRVQEKLPARDDALVSVDDPDSLAELVREILTFVLELGRPGSPLAGLSLPRRDSLAYVRAAALKVAEDPYAGQAGPAAEQRTGSRELRLALRELERERLPPEQHIRQRRELENRLNAALNRERDERARLERTVRTFTGLLRSFFQRMARLLPESVGGEAPLPRLEGGVRGSRNPLLAATADSNAAAALTINTSEPAAFRLAGLELRLRQQAGMNSLNVAGREARLEPYFTVESEHGWLEGFTRGEWLHLRLQAQRKPLAVLLAEALAVDYCHSSPEWPDLRLMLAVLADSPGSEPRELVRRALDRLAELSATAPERRTAINGFIRGSARAARVSLSTATTRGLVQRFHVALTIREEQLQRLLGSLTGAETAVRALTSEPLEFRLGGQHLTVRNYRSHGQTGTDSLVVLLPGRTLGSFTDMLIEPLAGGTLLIVRADWELAAVWLKKPAARAA